MESNQSMPGGGPMAGVARMAAAIRDHVASVPQPEPACATLHPREWAADIQPRVHGADPATVIGTLLVWAHCMEGITADWWHTPEGSLHITITGRIPGGIRLKVYSAIEFTDTAGHVRLAAGQRESTSPDELYHLALALRAQPNATATAATAA